MAKKLIKPRSKRDELHSAGYDAQWDQSARHYGKEPYTNFWLSVVLCISLAGSLWPFSRFLINIFEPASTSSLLSLPVSEMVFAGMISLLFGGTVCIVTLALLSSSVALGMNLILKTLNIEQEQIGVGSATGGIAGLLLALPFCFAEGQCYLYAPLLLGTATLLTQLGGTWGAWRVLNSMKEEGGTVMAEPSIFQFGVRQLLLLAVWFAVGLTTLRYLGVLSEKLLVLVGIWSALQVVFFFLIALIMKRWKRVRADQQEGEA